MQAKVAGFLRRVLLAGAISLPAAAAAQAEQVFRVCADPANLPFSARSLDGFENKIAALWAEELGLPVAYTWFPQRRGFVRNTLKALDESGNNYKCDVVIGVAASADDLLTTKPYYRSTYALVFARGGKLSEVGSADDFIALDADTRKQLKIGAFTPTPGVKWLARHDMLEQLVAYPAMSGDPDAYPGEIIEKELVSGNLDAAIIWGPIAGYFAKNARNAELVLIPLQSEPGIRFDFAISAGVRYGDGARKQQLEELMQRTAGPMAAILAAYNVPLLDLASMPAYESGDDDD